MHATANRQALKTILLDREGLINGKHEVTLWSCQGSEARLRVWAQQSRLLTTASRFMKVDVYKVGENNP